MSWFSDDILVYRQTLFDLKLILDILLISNFDTSLYRTVQVQHAP